MLDEIRQPTRGHAEKYDIEQLHGAKRKRDERKCAKEYEKPKGRPSRKREEYPNGETLRTEKKLSVKGGGDIQNEAPKEFCENDRDRHAGNRAEEIDDEGSEIWKDIHAKKKLWRPRGHKKRVRGFRDRTLPH